MGKSDIESGSIFPLFSIYTRRQSGMFLHDQRDIPIGVRVFPSRLGEIPTVAFKVNELVKVRDLLVNHDVVNEHLKKLDFSDSYSVFVSKIWYIDPTKANPFQSLDIRPGDNSFSVKTLDPQPRLRAITKLYESDPKSFSEEKLSIKFGLMFISDGFDHLDNFFSVVNDPERPWEITHIVGYELSLIKK